jgi:hypothetical protein
MFAYGLDAWSLKFLVSKLALPHRLRRTIRTFRWLRFAADVIHTCFASLAQRGPLAYVDTYL